MKPCNLLGNKVARFLMSPKDSPQQIQFSGSIKKLARLFPRLKNANWLKTPTDSTVIEPKYVGIPMFLHIPRALDQEQICIHRFIRKIWLGKKFFRCTGQKPNYNSFRVPIHFAADRFTFEKFPPPPPLLHTMN